MPKRKRILISGATGFIGANLVRKLLAEGAEVSVLTRQTSNKWRIRDILAAIKEYSVDLRDVVGLKAIMKELKPEIIIHSAVYGGFVFQNDVQEIMTSNLLGTVNLLTAAREVNFELFVNTGSSSEYGFKSSPMVESNSLSPVDEYGVAKAAASLFCRTVAYKYDLPIVTLRLFSPYGYYDDRSRLVFSVILDCLAGHNPSLASPNSVRDFIFIEDVVAAYVKAIKKGSCLKGEIINIGSGKQYYIKDVVKNIINLTNKSLTPSWDNLPIRRMEPKSWQADIKQAQKLLSWEPKYNLREGLIKTIKWVQGNNEII